jgi:hypothetical protein
MASVGIVIGEAFCHEEGPLLPSTSYAASAALYLVRIVPKVVGVRFITQRSDILSDCWEWLV